MTRPRLILAIRCAVLAVALWCIGAPWWMFALCPLALMMPVFAGGCDGTCGDGGRCANSQESKSIAGTIAGMANLNCIHCGDYNKTYNLPEGGTGIGPGGCGYTSSGIGAIVPQTCGSNSGFNAIQHLIQNDGSGNTRVATQLEIYDSPGATFHLFQSASIGASPANCCITTVSLAFFSTTVTSATQRCDATGASCTWVGSDH
jgi:hypothetical protein